MKKALRETQTLRALAVVRFGHRPTARPPARPLSQTYRQDRLQYTAPQLASAQWKNVAATCDFRAKNTPKCVCGRDPMEQQYSHRSRDHLAGFTGPLRGRRRKR